ncbi:MAG: hypothetical protein KAX30_04535 [Candidatus Atribacteria bacterium]|nr:hypothetical protein [Candidatus Atribacteria bacterium]
MSNFLKPEKVKAVRVHIEKGDGIRKTSRETGVSKNTVTKIQGVIIAEKISAHEPLPLCGCGQPVGHKGCCSYRLANSPKRQKFLSEQWGGLSFDSIAKLQLEVLKKEKANIQSWIKKLMVEFLKIDTKISFLDEYLQSGCSLDNMSKDEIEDIFGDPIEQTYIDQIIQDKKDKKSTGQ